jgi:hypothetical protein
MKSFYDTGTEKPAGKPAWKYTSPKLVSFIEEVEFRGKKANQLEGFETYHELAERVGFNNKRYFTQLYYTYREGVRNKQPWQTRVLTVLGYPIQD